MVLGGPVAGGWVAAIATIELRELREVPWFGTLSNHGIVTLAAVIGGLVVTGASRPVRGSTRSGARDACCRRSLWRTRPVCH